MAKKFKDICCAIRSVHGSCSLVLLLFVLVINFDVVEFAKFHSKLDVHVANVSKKKWV